MCRRHTIRRSAASHCFLRNRDAPHLSSPTSRARPTSETTPAPTPSAPDTATGHRAGSSDQSAPPVPLPSSTGRFHPKAGPGGRQTVRIRCQTGSRACQPGCPGRFPPRFPGGPCRPLIHRVSRPHPENSMPTHGLYRPPATGHGLRSGTLHCPPTWSHCPP